MTDHAKHGAVTTRPRNSANPLIHPHHPPPQHIFHLWQRTLHAIHVGLCLSNDQRLYMSPLPSFSCSHMHNMHCLAFMSLPFFVFIVASFISICLTECRLILAISFSIPLLLQVAEVCFPRLNIFWIKEIALDWHCGCDKMNSRFQESLT
jgi:hypothetical protein